jgi:phosphohistidine phosphatase SixA
MIALLFAPLAAFADEDLWTRLQNDPNMVVFMRNAESSGNLDGANMLVWDSTGKCSGESALTAVGREQAKAIGAAFAKHGIKPIVISSPMCRCKDTARIAFGEYVTDPELRQRPTSDIEGEEVFQATASALLRKHRGKLPIVFVNHRPNIDAMTMELIQIGELLVGTATEDGEFESATTPRGGGLMKAPRGGHGVQRDTDHCYPGHTLAPTDMFAFPRTQSAPRGLLSRRAPASVAIGPSPSAEMLPSLRSADGYLQPLAMHAGTAEPRGVHRQRRWLTRCELLGKIRLKH